MATDRILLLEVPRLLRGILEHAIAAHGNFELLRNGCTAKQSLSQPEAPPDVVILGLSDPGDTAMLLSLFARWPQARIMTLTVGGDNATVYELRLGRKTLEVVSPDEILHVLRNAVSRPRVRAAL